MNWDQVQGQFKQLGGKIKQKWAKLTDDDLQLLSGKKDEFIGKLQERYGYKKEEAEREVDGFLSDFDTKGKTTH
ncbi:MAG: CsbD family protein [Archangiaceae bacterium]|nr:CsbD family protein [Archangiaceae bacterium]